MIIRTEQDRQYLMQKISNAPVNRVWEIKIEFWHPKASYRQIKLYWMWIQEIIDFFIQAVGRYKTKEQINDWLLDLFAPIDVFPDGAFNLHSVSKMNVFEMSQFLDKIDIFCASEFQLLLTKPISLYPEAVYHKGEAA